MAEQIIVLSGTSAQDLENKIFIAVRDGYQVKYESYRVSTSSSRTVYSVMARK